MKMKWIIGTIAVLILAFAFYGIGMKSGAGIVEINDVILNVEVADDLSEHSRGLMYRESLDENSGMIFIFKKEQQMHFWMKNVKINLDMIFMGENFKIVGIEKDVVPCNEIPCPNYGSDFLAKYVLEVNGGFADEHGISVGDSVKFTQNA